jgi:radial spoke head protein 3
MTKTSSFTYNTQPHSAPRSLRTENVVSVPLSMMSDPRVIRGNTFAMARKISKERTNGERSQQFLNSQGSTRRDSFGERQTQPYYNFESKPFSLGNMSLSQYLTDQSEDEIIQARVIETQTDEFSNLPPPLPFIPPKTGKDQGTQIDNNGELFDFDAETSSMVTIIVQKTLEQALLEVNQEEEIFRLREEITHYEEELEQEFQWMKMHEATIVNEQRKVFENVQAIRVRIQKIKQLKQITAGLQMTRQILGHSLEEILQSFESPSQILLDQDTIPGLIKDMNISAEKANAAESVVDGEIVSLFRC